MWIEAFRQCGEIDFQNLHILHLLNVELDGVIPAVQPRAHFVDRFIVEQQLQHFVLHAFPPALVEFFRRLGPGCLLGIDVDRFVDREVEILVDQLLGIGESLMESLAIDVKRLIGEVDVTFLNRIVERLAKLAEAVDIGLQEVESSAGPVGR